MDPLSAFSLATNILTFVDCGIKLFSYASEINKSSTGSLATTETIRKYATHVMTSIDLIKISQSLAATRSSANDFQPLLDECTALADEIRTCIEKLRAKPGRGKLWSLEKAVLNMTSSKHIEDLLKRLERVQSGVMMRFTIESQESNMAATREVKRQLLDIKALLSDLPKELGYPWETGLPKDQVIVDDGLDLAFLLPLDLCSTPQAFIEILRVKYTLKKLPGKRQMERGDITIWDWAETRQVKTKEEWSALAHENRRVKLAFALGSPWVWDSKKCFRCGKPGIRKDFTSKFKTCKSCDFSIYRIEPLDFPRELQDSILHVNHDRYHEYRRSSTRNKGRPSTPATQNPGGAAAPETQSSSSESQQNTPPKEPTIDLVCRRMVVKWEPMINIVHRYVACRCILRLTSPASCEREMTILVAYPYCPRHNSEGITFLDYGDQDYGDDPYFDKFGGYDKFKFHVSTAHGFLTQEAWNALLEEFHALPEENREEFRLIMVEYWLENMDLVKGIDVKIPAEISSTLRERKKEREERKKKWGDISTENLSRLEKIHASWIKEITDILEHKWDGKPHWAVEDE